MLFTESKSACRSFRPVAPFFSGENIIFGFLGNTERVWSYTYAYVPLVTLILNI